MDIITLINSNGIKYTQDLPKIVIQGHINDGALAHIKENTGLIFERETWPAECYGTQPIDAKQIVALLMTYNFKSRYYNNQDYKNTLFLKSDHHIGFDVDSICFECVKKNNINTNMLNIDDRLAC